MHGKLKLSLILLGFGYITISLFFVLISYINQGFTLALRDIGASNPWLALIFLCLGGVLLFGIYKYRQRLLPVVDKLNFKQFALVYLVIATIIFTVITYQKYLNL